MTHSIRNRFMHYKDFLFYNLYKLINLVPDPKSKIESDASTFWNSSKSSENLRDLSHIKGHGRWSKIEQWTNIGTKHANMLNNLSNYLQRKQKIWTVLEWGPGGGANAAVLCNNAEKYYGVDISEYNLKQCELELKNNGYENFVPIKIDVDKPQSCLDYLDQKVDIFLCTAVYQHFPSKEYGIRVTELVKEILVDNGLALIQIRYDNEKYKYRPKYTRYKQNALSFTSYKIDEFWTIIEKCGLRPLYIELNPEINYAYYSIVKS